MSTSGVCWGGSVLCDGTSAGGRSGGDLSGEAGSWGTSVEGSRLVGCAARRGGDASSVWHGGDGAERLRGLLVGGDDTISTSIDTWEVLVVTEAGQEDVVDVGSGGVISATDTIENVLAVVGSVSTSGIASLEAELASTHKVVPFNGLLELTGESIREEEGTEWVTTLIGTVGVEFTSRVVSSEINVLLGDVTSDLDVVGCLYELDTGEGTSGDDTGAIVGLCAPSDGFTLSVTDGAVGGWWTPEAKVVNRVDDGGLAERVWSASGGVAQVVTVLGSTLTIVGICLVGQSTPSEMLRGKRNTRLSESNGQETRNDGDGGCKGRHFNRY